MITYSHFSVSPMKKRILFIKKVLNTLGYNLEESVKEDKQYKKALKHYQISKGYAGNCMIDNKTFESLLHDCSNLDKIWNNLKNEVKTL